ncbi:MAG: hypothetical protein M1120_01730 [Patescibacteria group bacterium]|nr:hypothetical protein [Patescibacteria group bacterium]
MKIQDLGFLAVLAAFLVVRKPRLLVFAGLGCLVLSVPLFYFHIFFTAERLTWYGAGFFLTYIILFIINELTS